MVTESDNESFDVAEANEVDSNTQSERNTDIILQGKHVPVKAAFERVKGYVEAGKGNWRCTNVSLKNEQTHAFELSCATCNKVFSPGNPSNFWTTHKKKCTPTATGQVLDHSAGTPCRPV